MKELNQTMTRREAIKGGAIGLASLFAMAAGLTALPEIALASPFSEAKAAARLKARQAFKKGTPSAYLSTVSTKSFKKGKKKYTTKTIRIVVRQYNKTAKSKYKNGKTTSWAYADAFGSWASIYPSTSESGTWCYMPGEASLTLTGVKGSTQKINVRGVSADGDYSKTKVLKVKF